MTDQAADIRDDALSVLRDVLGWYLAPVIWEDIGEVLDGVERRLDLADPDQVASLREAMISLDLAAPVRDITRISKDATPAPDPIRERVVRLMDELARPVEIDDRRSGDSSSGARNGS